jgi:hypothetical protein
VHSLGLTGDGSIVGWGDNASFQCNVPAPNAGFVAVAAGLRHNLGLRVGCSADLDGDGDVSLQDLAVLLAHFGGSGDPSDGDLDGDGDVDLQDLANLLANFGTTCE